VWLPDSDGVAESAHCGAGAQRSVNGIRVFDLTGKPTRTIPAAGSLVFLAPFSPDGRLLLLAGEGDQSVIVVDASTGAVRARLPRPVATAATTGGGVLGWYDAQHLAL